MLDPLSHRSLDDWNTFYQGGTRLVKYLRFVGYNALMMSVLADGSTIYPSRLVEPTPRYDTGGFSSAGQDPQRKDVLELLLRLFDREGLMLVPGLDFASPLAELETIRRAGGEQATGLEWVGADGRTWLAANRPHQGLAPYYNTLDPRVQEAMLRVVRELATRYGKHESFGGVALQLSADGYAQLPGDDWGFDDRTIARFEQETGTRVPGSGAERFAQRAQYLTGEGHAAWVTWRASTMAEFHRRLRGEIVTARQGAKLYLAGGTMLESRQSQYRLRPTLPRRARLDEALAELGIRPQAYRGDSGIVLLRAQHLAPSSSPLAARAADLEINLAPEMDRLVANGRQTGSLFYHEPQKARLASFDIKSPFGAVNTYTWLVSQMSPSGDKNRQRFVHSLATLDAQEMFDGGWMLSLGQEEALGEIVSIFRQLPAQPFETVPGEIQPVTIRTLSLGRQSYVYLVNDSPWEASVSVALDLPAEARMEKIGQGRGVAAIVRSGAATSWKVNLRPYDLAAVRFTAPGVHVRNPQVVISEQVRDALQRRIDDLWARVAALGRPQPISVLENSGFEAAGDAERIPGWNTEIGTGGALVVDDQQHHGGGQALRLTSGGSPVSITSAPFDPPPTGRLAIEVWLRAAEGARQPALRISLEGQLRDGRFDPFGVIPAVGANAKQPGEWMRYSFPLDHLPVEGLTNLRVKFELASAGEVWIDDVQVFDLAFSEAERKALVQLLSLASLNLERGQISDCASCSTAIGRNSWWPTCRWHRPPWPSDRAPARRRVAAAGRHEEDGVGEFEGLLAEVATVEAPGASTRWPLQRTAAEQVEVEVVDRLAGVGSTVDDHAVAAVELQFGRQPRDDEQQVAQQRGVGFSYVAQRRDFLFGDDDHVRWRLRSNVVKRQAAIVLVDDAGGDLAVDDALEYGLFGHRMRFPFRQPDKPLATARGAFTCDSQAEPSSNLSSTTASSTSIMGISSKIG